MLSTMFNPIATPLANKDVRQPFDEFRRSVDEMPGNFCGRTMPTSDWSKERAATFGPIVERGGNDHFQNLQAILPGVGEERNVIHA